MQGTYRVESESEVHASYKVLRKGHKGNQRYVEVNCQVVFYEEYRKGCSN